ncbi:MAG: hypothetical protein LRZ88_05330 [Candidatus Cloacimonetes bacterium]|nr:hypothetical protein [Candidatus Cloacimonadota bacterium]
MERRRNLSSWLLSLPTMIWLTAFFLIPYFIVVIYSFLSPDIYDVKFEVSLDAYRQIFSGEYLRSFLLSFRLAFYTTLLCILLGFPVAYFIARAGEKLRNTLLIFIIIPFWTNLIIRIFSWRIFFGLQWRAE